MMKRSNVQYWYYWTVNSGFFIALFVKPEEIPKISKNLGLLYRKISRYYYNFKFELDEMNDFDQSNDFDTKQNFLKKKTKTKKK